MTGLLLIVIVAVLYDMSYSGHSGWKTAMILKEQSGNLYVQEEGRLLRLRCPDTVDFDEIMVDNNQIYVMGCRWNRWTGERAVIRCTDTPLYVPGDVDSLIGSGMVVDPGKNDTLFGYPVTTRRRR